MRLFLLHSIAEVRRTKLTSPGKYNLIYKLKKIIHVVFNCKTEFA